MMMSTFFVFDWKYLFYGKRCSKVQKCLFKVEFGTYTDSNIHNLMLIFIFSILNQKYPFLGNFGPKTNIVSVS